METWNIQRLLNWITGYFTDKGIDSPRLSAELLLSHVLDLTRIELYTQFDKPVEQQQLHRLHALVKRAGRKEPVAYLIGRTEFYSLQLSITPDCLIPRPETELLVGRAVEFLRNRASSNHSALEQAESGHTRAAAQSVCDLCTGSGCIAVAIAGNFPQARIIATDISDAALRVAAENVRKHELQQRITLLQGDLFEPLIRQLDTAQFDLIVCNPPYVSAPEFETLDKNVRDYEPKIALLAGTDGLDVYRRIVDQVDRFLKPDAAIMLETGYAQGPDVKALLERTGAFEEITIEKDSHNNDRIVTATKQNPDSAENARLLQIHEKNVPG